MPAEHWWASHAELAAFALLSFFAFGPFRRHKTAADILLKIIATYILIYKLFEYGAYAYRGGVNSIPVDFSAVTYFVFGLSAWLPFKTVKKIAASAAFLTGFAYSLAFIILPEVFFAKAPAQRYLFIAATINHTIMYFGALLALSRFKLEKADALKIPLGFSLFVAYAYIVVDVFKVSTTAVIFDIAEGKILSYAIKDIEFTAGYYVLYYACCLAALVGVTALLFYLNKRLFSPAVFLETKRGFKCFKRTDYAESGMPI